MSSTRKPKKRDYSADELYNPQIDLSRDGVAYGRQSSKDQVVKNIQSHISQTIMLIGYTKETLGFCENGTTGQITLFIENQVSDTDGNVSIKNASGTWPIDKRPGLQTICDLIESGKIGVVVAEHVDRLFRDEDRIDSNIFIKICRENNCYVHISSKRMTYNFANPQHAELFRMEVLMAAMYIENHVRNTMLKRREIAAKSGEWAGYGMLPVNFIVDKRQDSKTYKQVVPYWPHARISVELYDRLIELGFDLDALCLELARRPYIYPEFEEWVWKGDYLIHTNLPKAPGGKGYTLSRDGFDYMFCNVQNIGAVKRKGQVIYGHHEAIIDEDRFWLVYDQLRIRRPDGTPTGKSGLKRYTQERSRDSGTRKRLLTPETTLKNGSVYFNPRGQSSYCIYIAKGLVKECLSCVNGNQLEAAIVNRMFTHLQTANLGDLKAARKKRSEKIDKRLKDINRDVSVIEEELENLKINLRTLTIVSVIKDTEQSMARILARKNELLQEQAQLLKAAEGEALRTLEEELADLETLWPQKPFPLKEAILKVLIKRVVLDQVAPKFCRVTVEWKYREWGIETTYLMQEHGSRKQWAEDELHCLRQAYSSGKQKLEIMQALPQRSWKAIQIVASEKHMNGGKRIYFGQKLIEHPELSWMDTLWLKSENLSFEHFSSNEVGWSCLSLSVSTPEDNAKLINAVRLLLKRPSQKKLVSSKATTALSLIPPKERGALCL